MRRILIMLVVAAVLVAGCGGDDDAADDGGSGAGTDTTTAEPSGDDGGSDDGSASDDDGGTALDPVNPGIDGDLADFPIPSPPGATDGAVTDVDGALGALVFYPADQYDEVVDWYVGWFTENDLIANEPDRSLGQVVIGGEQDGVAYSAIIIGDDTEVAVQLIVE